MSRHLRIGSLPYLNAAPLVFFLRDALAATNLNASVSVRRLPPSQLGEAMTRHELDAALLPVVDYLNGIGACILPDISISSRGAVGSVLLFARAPLKQLRRIGVTTASKTSVALLQVLLKERWGLEASFIPLPHVPDEVPAEMEAVLLIGDDALSGRKRIGAEVYDLGGEWHTWTGLPFVYAAWVVANPSDAETLYTLLHTAKAEGLRRLPEIVTAHKHVAGMTADELTFYLSQNLDYGMGAEHLEAIRRFQELCCKHGIINGSPRTVTLCGRSEGQPPDSQATE